ncbi:hypothetical protein KAFR_0C01970 [Kazachstania africana CBS 2517]|uniref:MARVEL domain-containing protein n=1 Tax=Kazachstania africana (strain ATCC 22294 / BCRC 22015 / CBS 2517 / CECT 1963 / NBRC 1671 / NRRL Y-8276) TaxID=1071382 RepID=H2AS40_KAZAF|nr:hypothetical protein KAFR_0C01970 [Kazachstania africana CBS 2517]CCF57190.1 hypothetical protein KAFR_0C01970 [Kazachstania africana CBS 2517]
MLGVADNILRLINAVFLIIAIALTSALINTQNGHHNSRVNYCMFACAFGLFFDSIYGICANFFQVLAWPLLLFTLDFLNFAFTFSAATALAVGIRAHSCGNQSYLDSNKIVRGSGQRCREAQALVAFLYFSTAIFIAKMIMSCINLFQNGAFSSGSSRFISRRKKHATDVGGVPNISQV